MGLTAAAEWLNGFFNNFDSAILTFYHGAAGTMGNFLTPLMVFISYFGAKGIFSIILSLILMLFSRTRKAGLCALLAVGIGAILCNVILKPQIARPRPYTVSPYDEWWKDVGAHAEKDMSFPSGHVNVITATLAGIFLVSKKKKYTWTLLFGVILMAASRNYLMVHYPSDVMFGMKIASRNRLRPAMYSAFSSTASNRHIRSCGIVVKNQIRNVFAIAL